MRWLRNAHLEVEVDVELGAEIRVVRRPGGPNVLATYDWVAPVSVRRSTSYGEQELDWLSDYRGAWQELFPNAGPPCTVDGVPLPFHGEASRSAWTIVGEGPGELVLMTPARLPLVLERFLSSDPRQWGTELHYTAPFAPILVFAAADALRRLTGLRARATEIAAVCAAVSVFALADQPLPRLVTPSFYRAPAFAATADRKSTRLNSSH